MIRSIRILFLKDTTHVNVFYFSVPEQK